MSDVLIIIPAYNEESNIERVVDHLVQNFPQYDYVVVNDGSKDSTGEICKRRGYNFLDLPVNLGLAGAYPAGIRYAHVKGYECAIQLDGDGQHRPDFVRDMKAKMDEGYDIVIGSRFINEKKPMTMRMLGSNMLEFAIRLTTGADIKDPTSGMRMFSKKMIREFAQGLNYGPEPDTVSYLVKQGAKVAEVPVIMDERISGTSYLTPFRAAKYMTQMMVSILLIQNFRKRNQA